MFYNGQLDVNLVFYICSQTESTGFPRARGPSGETHTVSPQYRRSRPRGDRFAVVCHHVQSASVANECPNLTPAENHLRPGTMTKSCFRPHEALNLPNHLCSLYVHPASLDNPTIVPSHIAVVADSGWHALHAASDAFLGVHSTAGAVSRHRKFSPDAERPCCASRQWAQR